MPIRSAVMDRNQQTKRVGDRETSPMVIESSPEPEASLVGGVNIARIVLIGILTTVL